MRVVILFIFYCIPNFSFCQKVSRPYDVAVERIANKSWNIYKICNNDSCWIPVYKTSDNFLEEEYSYYFQFFEKEFKITQYPTTPLSLTKISCQPIISFINSNTNKDNSFAIWAGAGDHEQGELKFISDSEFVVNPLYGLKYYYRLTKTPVGFFELYGIPKPKNGD